MYAINALKDDVKRVELMMGVVEDFTDGREFLVDDIPTEKRKNYAPALNGWGCFRADFTGNSMMALVRRGLAEIVRKEDYIYKWEDGRGKEHKEVGTHTVYRLTGKTVEDYKTVMSKAIVLAVCGC